MYPQFELGRAGGTVRVGRSSRTPATTTQYFSQIADIRKRLTCTIDVPAGGADLSFWTSYDTEAEWDFLAVEAHTPGQDDWTTPAGSQREHVAGHR